MICPQCSATNDDAANYCNDCGRQLQVRICPECSSANIDTARFYNHCGFEFEDEDYEGESAEDEQLPGLESKPPSKKTSGLVVGMVLLCVLLGAGIPIFVGVYNWIAALAPTNVVQTYCNDLINKDALGAYQQFSLDLQLQIPSDTFAAGVRAGVYAQDGGLKKCNVVKLVINHDTRAVAFLDLIKGNGKVEPTIIDLVLENGVWKIEHPGGVGTSEL